MAPVHHRYEWLYVYGFVRPATGQTFWLVLPRVNKELFSLALSEFAEWVGAGKDKRVVLAVDRAGWHTSEDVALPEGLHLLKLPSHSPEPMPAERLWPLVDEPTRGQPPPGRPRRAGGGALVERCRGILARPEAVRSRTRFHWWREAAC